MLPCGQAAFSDRYAPDLHYSPLYVQRDAIALGTHRTVSVPEYSRHRWCFMQAGGLGMHLTLAGGERGHRSGAHLPPFVVF